MRIVLTLVVIAASLCFVGYGLAVQPSGSDARPSQVSQTEAAKESPPSPFERHPTSIRQATHTGPRVANTTAPADRYTPSPLQAIPDKTIEPQSQQLAVVISQTGLRFLSPRAGYDINGTDLAADDVLVLCDKADVTTDTAGKAEVVCHAATVIKTAGMDGSTGTLHYKNGVLFLEGDDSDSLIAQNKGDKTIFLLRAKSISFDLNTRQIRANNGATVQLKAESEENPGEKQKDE